MAVVILQNVPPGSQVGLDLHTWQTGPNFRGIRNVSDGLHCLHVAIKDVTTTKYAAWLDITRQDSVAYRWVAKTEVLISIEMNTSQHQIEPLLFVEFPSDPDHAWSALASHITSKTISAIVPLNSVLTSMTPSNMDEILNEVPVAATEDETTLQFLPIDLKRSWPPGTSGRELTEMSLDKSWLLSNVVERLGSPGALLGQFELCFLCVLLFTSLAAFDQWHVIFKLFCSCKNAVFSHDKLYADFLASLQAQVQQLPRELFSDIFGLTIPRHLNMLRQNIKHASEDNDCRLITAVQENLDVLMDTLSREFNIEDEDHAQQQATYPVDDYDEGDVQEDDEDAPTIVEL